LHQKGRTPASADVPASRQKLPAIRARFAPMSPNRRQRLVSGKRGML
jgi:hypothetical protein